MVSLPKQSFSLATPELLQNASNCIIKLTFKPQEDLKSGSQSTIPPQKQKYFHLANIQEPKPFLNSSKSIIFSIHIQHTPISFTTPNILHHQHTHQQNTSYSRGVRPKYHIHSPQDKRS